MAILAGMTPRSTAATRRSSPCSQQITDRGDVIGGEVDLGGDLGIGIPPFLEGDDLAHQLERARVAASQVLDQAHHITVLLGRFDNDRRDLALSQGDECFQPPLTTDEVILRLGPAAADANRPFEAEMSNAGDQLMEDPSVAGSRIEHGDRGDRDHLDFASGCHSADPRPSER
jgi:hypothetical protein